MSVSNTIFMALEQEQQPITITSFICVYCNKSNNKGGFFTILREGGIQLFCSQKCADREKKRRQELICAHCGKSFETAKNKVKYCSKSCNRSAQYSRYKKFNWCTMCNEWIKKEDSLFKPKGSAIYHGLCKYITKKDNQFCPTCKNRLRVRNWYNNRKKNGNTTRTTTAETV